MPCAGGGDTRRAAALGPDPVHEPRRRRCRQSAHWRGESARPRSHLAAHVRCLASQLDRGRREKWTIDCGAATERLQDALLVKAAELRLSAPADDKKLLPLPDPLLVAFLQSTARL